MEFTSRFHCPPIILNLLIFYFCLKLFIIHISYSFFSSLQILCFFFLVCCCTHNNNSSLHSLTKYLVLVMIVHGKLAIELYANDCETVSIMIPSIVSSLSHLFLFSNEFAVAFACEKLYL